MKKQILFFAVTLSALSFYSCRKDNQELTEKNSVTSVEKTSMNNTSAQRSEIDLSNKLDGWFEFNGNLKDNSNNLANGLATGRPVYVADRRGRASSALYLDGSYGVNISNVPEQTHTSLTAWVKYAALVQHYLVTPNGSGPAMDQYNNKYFGFVGIGGVGSEAVVSGILDNKWHHLAITFDGLAIRFYTDGVLAGTKSFVSGITPVNVIYHLGWRPEQAGFWKGSLDDLRFYGRTLNASEVSALAKP